MSKIASSPDRYTFQADSYIKRCEEAGEEPSESYLDLYKSARQQDEENLLNPKWQKNNMEYDLRSTEWICQKAKDSEVYAQNLYAAMCNTDWCKLDTANAFEILKENFWSCSWRSAGGIVANMIEKGDYIDWYCSGINNGPLNDEDRADMTPEAIQKYDWYRENFISESVITDEIAEDLKKLGWISVQVDDQA